MQSQSGMFKAGNILLLIGAILHVVGAVFLIVFGVFFLVISHAIGVSGGPFGLYFVATLYIVLGVLLAIGSVFGFVAHSRSSRGDAHGAWVLGLASSLLPPLQIVTLLGAIFCLVSPEGEAAKRP